MCVSYSVVSDFSTLRTVAQQAPLFMGFPRQEYWSGLPFPSPWDLPDLGIEPVFPALQADSLPLSHQGRQILKLRKEFNFLKFLNFSEFLNFFNLS